MLSHSNAFRPTVVRADILGAHLVEIALPPDFAAQAANACLRRDLNKQAQTFELRPKNWTQKQRFLDNTSGLLGSPLGLELGRGEVA